MRHLGDHLLVGHFSDLHYSTSNLAEADRCFGFAVEDAIASRCAVGVVSGDSTDHRLDAHTPALRVLAGRIHQLSRHMPVLMLQGTFSHEPPGTLDLFPLMSAGYPVYVADHIHQVALLGGEFVASAGSLFTSEEVDALLASGIPEMVFTCVPTVNKAVLAAAVGAGQAATALGDHLAAYLGAAGAVNRLLRARGVRTLGVSHGTVNGCQTEHGVPMAGFDHEFSIGALFEAECDGFLLGHIHRAQQWAQDGRVVAYPGSIGRFHYGEIGDKGYLQWEVAPGRAVARQVVTPARETLCYDFDGPPDMERLATVAGGAADKFVRIRWTIDEEHRQLVDRDAICALFGAAAEVKLEGRVLPAVRSRAEGISRAASLGQKLSHWGELASVDTGPLLDRLGMLETADALSITDLVLAQLDQRPVETVAPAEPAATPERPQPVASTVATASPALDWLSDDLFAGVPA
ncbi:metallophosphatase family protein (plasmid) [Cupriavidus sp. USMAHM13]|uniref:metallophosphoesterase family protein n=1 Tax=Cupriavidus sp. USMAHM13 TaxID=1389192 RepID=UPI0008A6D8F5|nr:metallophosphatase family protein [Cupriavidus sp. USMAHM13]AOZ04204.1 metallophosphatase family protein [Cupriavidus sp. USMAHM13]